MGFDGGQFMKLDAIAYIAVFVVIVAAAGLFNLLGL